MTNISNPLTRHHHGMGLGHSTAEARLPHNKPAQCPGNTPTPHHSGGAGSGCSSSPGHLPEAAKVKNFLSFSCSLLGARSRHHNKIINCRSIDNI